MATYALKRSDLFPVGTVVGAYAVAVPSQGFDGPVPGTPVESQTVDAAGTATFVALAADTPYVFSAQVAGEWRRLRARSSVSDLGRTVGTGDTTSGAVTVANAAATTGSWQVGQRITGAGIPPGAYIRSISGATLTLSEKASATALGVALEGHRAYAWSARLARRRAAMGTS